MSEWSETTVSSIAAAIRVKRAELRMSAQQLADRTKELGHPVNRSSIAGWENGARGDRMLIGDAMILAEALNLPLAELLAEASTPTKDQNTICRALDAEHRRGKQDAVDKLTNIMLGTSHIN